ncbi:MAG: deoxyribonuclease IV [Verrucomicrobia bacterium]|nr:deoxyribonuclease IV [Verrucomicrobiota bacterium]
MIIGSHLSTAGGLHNALLAADDYGFRALALFVSQPRQWKLPPLTPENVELFLKTRKQGQVEVIVAHASYLLNLAGDDAVRDKSIAALSGELDRCATLGIEYLVLHPGSHEDEDIGCERIIAGLDAAMQVLPRKSVVLLIEGTAGQGKNLGHRFEHLGRILKGVKKSSRYGICLDTCHLFAAGYEVRTPDGWNQTMAEFDQHVGLANLKAIHCNDSLKPFGSRVDRHEHISQGMIGRQGFANVVNDERLRQLPFILETPKGTRESDGKDWDKINVATLKKLIRKS